MTIKTKIYSMLMLCLLLILSGCNKDKEEYFAEPGWLEPPIYTVLQQEGRFTKYLQCLDSTLYASVLKGAGLYTVFAPNDEAFTAYMTSRGYSSVANIPYSEIEKIVAYSICYSTFTLDSIGVQGGFKYKTQYYALPYKDPEFNNEWVVDQTMENVWTTSFNNYKFIPAFTNTFFSSFNPPLSASDYNVFFPDVTFSGKNIQSGEILKADMRAENGIIHVVS